MDQNIQDFPKEFKDLVRKCGNADILIGTDSNSHCTVWNCTETDKRGEFFEDFLIENNLACLNDNLTHMRSKLRKFSKIKNPKGKISYISLKREYKNAIKKAINYGWKKFTSNTKYPSEVSKLIKSFNNNKNNSSGLLKNQEGDYYDNPKDSLNILLN